MPFDASTGQSSILPPPQPTPRSEVDTFGNRISPKLKKAGLINFRSNLRNMKYGSGEGFPYIVTPIPSYNSNPTNTFLGEDSFGRTGRSNRAKTDVTRLSRFFTDGPGLLFTAKQIALEKSRPKTPYGPPRSFSPSSILSQVAVSGTGIHFDRSPIPLFKQDLYLYKTVNEFNTNDTNRLTILFSKTIGKNVVKPNKFGISATEGTLIKYSGGPGGLFTTIKKTKETTSSYKPGDVFKGYYTTFTLTSKQTANRALKSTTGFSPGGPLILPNGDEIQAPGISNFITELEGINEPQAKRVLGRFTDYEKFNRIKTFGAGDPGNAAGRDLSQYDVDEPTYTKGVDTINFKKIYDSKKVDFTKSAEDLIKFYIAVIDNNNPSQKKYVHFRAYITDFGDSYGANWSENSYVGRGESFYKYGGFSRDISLGFKVHVASKAELFPTYQKLNYLASTLAPDYSAPGYMRGNIIELTIGDYLNNVPGVVTGFSLGGMLEGSWDIARKDDGAEDDYAGELPSLIDVTGFTFKPIHNFVPQTIKNLDNPESKFISLGSTHKGYDPTSTKL